MRKLLMTGVAALAAITFAPLAQADGNAANLDQLVGSAYTQFQHGCTPSMSPQFQRIQWDSPLVAKVGRGASSTPPPA
jgi:hypothetical protein